MKITPLLSLDQNVLINSLFLDRDNGCVLIGTSDGRIIKMDMVIANAYLTGDRSIYAQIQDGFGNISDVNSSNLTYQLKNEILKVTMDKEVEFLNQVSFPISTTMLESKAEAIFTSPILSGGDDFVSWKSIEWGQTIPSNTTTRVYARGGISMDDIEKAEWQCIQISTTTGSVSVSLDNFNGVGSFLQIKVVLDTTIINISPSLYSLNIYYNTLNTSVFFTQKFILKKNSSPKSIILTANVDKPQYTEIKFGVSDGDTTEWSDYSNIDIDKLTSLSQITKDRLKIGIKFISYTNLYYPTVNEFAIMIKAQEGNLLNG